jgi:hypothetical protein
MANGFRSTAGKAGQVAGAVLVALALTAAPRAANGQAPVEKYDAGWALFLDNDALTLSTRDHDYTGGFALTLAGRRAQEWWFSLDPALGWLDRAVGIEGGEPFHALQVSMLAFTPGEIEVAEPIAGDRPYASIVYLANSRTTVDADANAAWQTSFALGALGLEAAKAGQRTLHHALAQDEPRGWDHQISEGGEPTARYTVARLKLRAAGHDFAGGRFELKESWAASAGYLTEVNSAWTLRWGRISAPWWSFTPERAEYMMEPAPVLGAGNEFYLWAGVKARARIYNAFLQGQLRDSALAYDFEDTRPLIGEAWLGLTRQFASGYSLSWLLRYQTSELRTEPGDRDLFWGGISVSRSF